METETAWLTINEHIINIYDEDELQKEDTMRKIGNSDFSTKLTVAWNFRAFGGFNE